MTDRLTDVTWPWPRLGMWLCSTSFNDATCCLKYTATNNWVTVKWATIGVQALRCWSLDTSETRSEILWDFWNVVLRRMEKTSWTNRVKNEEVLRKVKVEKNILHTIKRRKADWIGRLFRRKCLLKHVIEGTIEWREEEEKRRNYGWPWGKKKILEFQSGSTRSHSLENSNLEVAMDLS